MRLSAFCGGNLKDRLAEGSQYQRHKAYFDSREYLKFAEGADMRCRDEQQK